MQLQIGPPWVGDSDIDNFQMAGFEQELPNASKSQGLLRAICREGELTQLADRSYPWRARSARSVFHPLEPIVAVLEHKVDLAGMRVLQEPGAIALLFGSEQVDCFVQTRVGQIPRPSGSTRAHAARRNASGWETKIAIRPG